MIYSASKNGVTGGKGRSKSLKMSPFDSIAVCCTIFKLFDVE